MGMLTVLMITVTNYGQATGIRVCIELAEGLLQAAPLYLSLWYKVTELGTGGAIFFSVSSLAGACNGLIAYGLVKDFSNTPPFKPWQWLFLIEGAMSQYQNESVGSTTNEKRVTIARSQQAYNTVNATLTKSQIPSVFKQPLIYFLVAAYSGTIVASSSLTNFLPSITQDLAYSSVNTQLMSGPVYAVAFVSTIVFGYLSDRYQVRGPLAISLSAIAMVGSSF
ncbi:major facilitator superfamily domain-containing protein [Umbelopsis sp. PMI_123]|nr:major facilitator superfamily domain-containing protein [Umbelopsis sp. PMI_123]